MSFAARMNPPQAARASTPDDADPPDAQILELKFGEAGPPGKHIDRQLFRNPHHLGHFLRRPDQRHVFHNIADRFPHKEGGGVKASARPPA